MAEQDSTGQVAASAAEVYEAFFVPALFAEWAPRVADAAAIEHGHAVLDVGCGTGVLAREALERVGPDGSVVGLDRNPGMLAVAGEREPAVAWREGRAEELPFEDASFDAVTCQFSLMFFEDSAAALSEMWRVTRPGGRVAVAVWDSLDATPGYAAMAELLRRLFGDEAAESLRVPYAMGDTAALGRLFERAGLGTPHVDTVSGTARFPSIERWVYTDINGWTLAGKLDDDQYQRLLKEAEGSLGAFVQADGTVAFASPAHVVTAVKG